RPHQFCGRQTSAADNHGVIEIAFLLGTDWFLNIQNSIQRRLLRPIAETLESSGRILRSKGGPCYTNRAPAHPLALRIAGRARLMAIATQRARRATPPFG